VLTGKYLDYYSISASKEMKSKMIHIIQIRISKAGKNGWGNIHLGQSLALGLGHFGFVYLLDFINKRIFF